MQEGGGGAVARPMGRLPGSKSQCVQIPEQVQAHYVFTPQAPEGCPVRDGAGQTPNVVVFESALKLRRGEIARRSYAMKMKHTGPGAIDTRPAALPCAHTNVQVLDIGRLISFIETAKRRQLLRIVEGAAAAAVEDVALVLSFKRLIAADRKIRERPLGRHHGLARFLAAAAVQKDGFGDHVVVEDAYVREARAPDTPVHGHGKGQRLRVELDNDGGMCLAQEVDSAIIRTVVDDDDLISIGNAGQAGLQQLAAIARWDHDRDAGELGTGKIRLRQLPRRLSPRSDPAAREQREPVKNRAAEFARVANALQKPSQPTCFPELPPDKIAGAPEDVAHNDRQAGGTQHEMFAVLVEREETKWGERESEQTQFPIRRARLENHRRDADFAPAKP